MRLRLAWLRRTAMLAWGMLTRRRPHQPPADGAAARLAQARAQRSDVDVLTADLERMFRDLGRSQ